MSFLAFYLNTQLGRAAAPRGPWLIPHKLYNLVWYAARVVWFPFPASLAAVAAGWSCRDAFAAVFRRVGAAHGDRRESRAREGLVFALGVSILYVLLFSLSDRKADRYIFPTYYLIGACGLVATMRSWPGLRCLVEAVDRHHPVLPAALWLVTFCLSLLGGTLRLPRLELWAAE